MGWRRIPAGSSALYSGIDGSQVPLRRIVEQQGRQLIGVFHPDATGAEGARCD